MHSKFFVGVLLLLVMSGFVAAKSFLIIVDASGSMDDQLSGTSQSKIDAAKAAAKQFVQSANDEMALMVYEDCDSGGDPTSGSCKVWQDFTTSKSALVSKIDQIEPESSTPIANSIREGADYLYQTRGGGVIILLTDGEETCGGDPVAAAQYANSRGVDVVNVVGFALTGSAVTQMQNVAAAGNGQYYSADDASQLSSALSQAYTSAGGSTSGGMCCAPAVLVFGAAGLFALSRRG